MLRLIHFCRYSVHTTAAARAVPRRSTYSDRAGCNIVGLSEDDFTEKFVKGGGPGGQPINKTSNRVQLKHISGISVSCQETRYSIGSGVLYGFWRVYCFLHSTRDLYTNRKIARRILRDKLELIEKGTESKLGKRISRIQKRKYNAARCDLGYSFDPITSILRCFYCYCV